jgi:hypothetical protein
MTDSISREVTTDRELLRQLAIVPDEVPSQKKPVLKLLRKKSKEPDQAGDQNVKAETDPAVPEGEVPTE